jgi:monovalent cation:H+ antiporter-2, CPA2 family
MPGVRGALPETLAAVLTASIGISLALTGVVSAFGMKFARRFARKPAMPAPVAVQTPTSEDMRPVLVIGMSKVGRRVVDGLQAFNLPVMAAERDPDAFERAIADGYPAVLGDSSDYRFFETIGAGSVKTVVIADPDIGRSTAITPTLETLFPKVTRFVHARTEDEERAFAALGMRPMRGISEPTGSDLAAAVLQHSGIDVVRISDWLMGERERIDMTDQKAAV